jgi:hypothetical protein
MFYVPSYIVQRIKDLDICWLDVRRLSRVCHFAKFTSRTVVILGIAVAMIVLSSATTN